MKKNILLAIALMCFIGLASCKDDGSGGFLPVPPDDNDTTITPTYSFVGEWYANYSNDTIGLKVVFSDTCMTMDTYGAKYGLDSVAMHNLGYKIISNKKIELEHYPWYVGVPKPFSTPPYKTTYFFHHLRTPYFKNWFC